MEDRVFAWIRKYHMIQPGDRIVVGVSGGADSVCLLYMLLEYGRKTDISLAVVHVNHGIRGEEALRDQRFVEALCKKEGLLFFPYFYDVAAYGKEHKLSQEEAGRILRYASFEDCRKKWGGTKIALAHHQDDQAETVLHHLFRGSGLSGLAGIRPVRDGIIRPLLCMKRQEIEHYLRNRNIGFVTDSTNAKSCYTRNRIRQEILPLVEEKVNAQAKAHIAAAALDILEAQEILLGQADELYETSVREAEGGYCVAHEVFDCPLLLVKYVLLKCLGQLGGLRDLTREHLESICGLAKKEVGKEIALPRGVRIKRGYGCLRIERGGGEARRLGIEMGAESVQMRRFSYNQEQIPEKKYTKWFDYDKIKNSLLIRSRRPGDYLTVNDAGGRKKLKDYLIDCKIPREERDQVLLVADGSHILWVIGYRISEYYKVTKDTRQILEIRVGGGCTHERKSQSSAERGRSR